MDRVRRLVGVSGGDGVRKKWLPTGRGITVAVVDTGINPHMDFGVNKESRILAFANFVGNKRTYYDDCGHGTHVCGVVGGNGAASKGRYEGIAPGVKLVALKALNERGNGKISDVLNAFDWIISNKEKFGIRIVNISMGAGEGGNFDEDCKLVKGVERLWDNGLVVCVAAGNNGPKGNSITMPGISRKIITVGCVDDDISVIMNDTKVINYSGRGPTKNAIMKPEIVAPGGNVTSCGLGFTSYATKSGTSMATPVVSGLIALLLEKNPKLTNKEVKMILNKSAINTGEGKIKHGWGKIDVENMLRYA